MLPFDLTAARSAPGFWYVGTPYTRYAAGIAAAFDHACLLTAGLIKLGVPVFSPIAHSHPVARNGGLDALDVPMWMKADAPLMRAAYGLIVARLPGWRESRGVTEEIEHFVGSGKPIVHLEPSGLLSLLKSSRLGDPDPDRPLRCGFAREVLFP